MQEDGKRNEVQNYIKQKYDIAITKTWLKNTDKINLKNFHTISIAREGKKREGRREDKKEG